MVGTAAVIGATPATGAAGVGAGDMAGAGHITGATLMVIRVIRPIIIPIRIPIRITHLPTIPAQIPIILISVPRDIPASRTGMAIRLQTIHPMTRRRIGPRRALLPAPIRTAIRGRGERRLPRHLKRRPLRLIRG